MPLLCGRVPCQRVIGARDDVEQRSDDEHLVTNFEAHGLRGKGSSLITFYGKVAQIVQLGVTLHQKLTIAIASKHIRWHQ
jgi:hypothetical protein